MTRTFDNVTPIGIERSRRAHPSNQPAPPKQLALWQRQLLASTVRRWQAGAPIDSTDADDFVDILLGDTP